MTTKRITPGREGYKILFDENTVIMNYKFADAASKYGTKEYKLMKKIRKDFPGMAEVIVSGREQKSPKPNTRLTYEHMEKYISVYENADELKEAFKSVKALSSVAASPYKYVSDWFKKQFPDYDKVRVLQDSNLVVAPVKAPNIIDYKQKVKKAG